MDIAKTGSFIKEMRKEKGLTQKELADALYITDRAVSKWERGLSAPDISLLEPLADILGVTISEIIYGQRSNPEQNILKSDEFAKEIIEYSDNEIKTKVRRFKSDFIKSVLIGVLSALLIYPLFNDWIGGDGFGWRCVPAYINTKKAARALVEQDEERILKYIADSDEIYTGLLKLKSEGIKLYDRKTSFFRTRLDDSFLFTETEFKVEYDGLMYSFTCTGTYRNGKVEFMHINSGYWENPDHKWIEKLNSVISTYNPG